MKEQLYSIPVNDAYSKDCECPVCAMYDRLQSDAIDFTMGPSYMEDDIRMLTDKKGFCKEHLRLMYKNQNRLGLALMLLTHSDSVIKETKKLQEQGANNEAGLKARLKTGLFKKNSEAGASSAICEYFSGLGKSCYVCDRIAEVFDRYIATIFYLYRTEADFKKKFESSKGMCAEHYVLLRERALSELTGSKAEEFINTADKLFLENLMRVRNDLEWFTDKFDYRYENEPWKNSRDAIQRMMLKLDKYNPDDEG